MGDIAVIVVNYGTAALAIEAIESVRRRSHGNRRVTIHVVDNASPTDDAAVLRAAKRSRRWGDDVTLYLEAVNHGFGRAHNLVFRALADAPPEFVFLLNPDAQLKNEAVGILADFLEAHPKVAIAGCKIELPDGQPVTAAFRFPSAASELSDALAFGPVSRLLKRWEVPLSPALETSRVDWVAGAALIARYSALKSVGFFDDSYFLYYEEVDLMRQLAQAGWETWHVTEAEAVHAQGAATGVNSEHTERRRRPRYWYESWRHYFRKNHGQAGALLSLQGWMTGAAVNYGMSLARGRQPNAPLRFFGDVTRHVAAPLLGLAPDDEEGTAKPAPYPSPTNANLGAKNMNPPGLSFGQLVYEDLQTHDGDLLAQGFWALFWHRFGNWSAGVGPKLPRAILIRGVYTSMAKATEVTCGIMLPYTVVVGRRVKLEHFGGMILVANAIGNDVILRQNTTLGIARLDALDARPVIGDRAQIGAGAVLVGPIVVGDGAIIGANAVVTKSVPAGAVAGGVPAKILRQGETPVAGVALSAIREAATKRGEIDLAALGLSPRLATSPGRGEAE